MKSFGLRLFPALVAFGVLESGCSVSGSAGLGAVSVGISDLAATIVAGVALFAAFAWPIWGLVRWSGRWRIAAAVPAAGLVLWAIKDVVDIVRDPHDLLPIGVIIGAFLALPYMLVVTLWRRYRTKRSISG